MNEQAKRIERKQFIFEPKTGDVGHDDNRPNQHLSPDRPNRESPQHSAPRNVYPPSIFETASDFELPSQPPNDLNEPIRVGDALVAQSPNSDLIDPLISRLWKENTEALLKLPACERPYSTKVHKYPNVDILRSINHLADKELKSVVNNKEISFLDINSIVYVAAITAKMAMNDCQAANTKDTPKRPGWIVNSERRIESLRRKISQISVVIACTTKQKFTRHQRELQAKFRKSFGNT